MDYSTTVNYLFLNLLLRPASAGDMESYSNKINEYIKPENREAFEKTKRVFGVTKEDPFSAAVELVSKELQYSAEYANRQSSLTFYKGKASALSGGLFDIDSYLEQNPDILEAFKVQYNIGARQPEPTYRRALESFTYGHYVSHGYGEGRLIAPPVEEPAATPPANQPYQGGGGGGGGVVIPSYTMPEINTTKYEELSQQIADALEALVSGSKQELPEPEVPEVVEPDPIIQGDPFELLSTSRKYRGLSEFVGFGKRKSMTYLESIGRTAI